MVLPVSPNRSTLLRLIGFTQSLLNPSLSPGVYRVGINSLLLGWGFQSSSFILSLIILSWTHSTAQHSTAQHSTAQQLTMAGKVMRAIQYSSYGGGASALKHAEVAIPEPKADEVLVKVEAVTLNLYDCKIQKGMMRPFVPSKFPFIPGTDMAGEVVKVGSSVQKFKAGDKVVCMLPTAAGGALAEYAVSKESFTVARPAGISAPEASALPVAALTAHQALTQCANIKLDGSGDRKNILITAASGGVGHYAVQLAKLGNTHVTATCGARNVDFVRSLGADEVLDYRTPEGASLKSPSGKKYDYIIHCASGISWSTFDKNLSENGKVVDLTPSPSGLANCVFKKLTFSKKQLTIFFLSPKVENLEFLVNVMKEKKIRTTIDSTFPLSKAEEAWAKVLDGHATGKIIVEP